MPELLRGPHHCVGIATSVTERIFHFLKTRAEAQGGLKEQIAQLLAPSGMLFQSAADEMAA